MRHMNSRRILAMLLALCMMVGMLSMTAFAADAENSSEDSDAAGYIIVSGDDTATHHTTFEAARDAARAVDGVVTYTVYGRVTAGNATDPSEQWIGVLSESVTDANTVKFVGAGENAEIALTGTYALLADNTGANVEFTDLKLSHNGGAYSKGNGTVGHATNYFSCFLRNTNQSENTVTYTNCEFPNGACNNQYGKTVYDGCKFTNTSDSTYNLWNYGGTTTVRNNSEFTGGRGIKVYNEGKNGGTVEVANTSFNLNGSKAAVVVSTLATVTMSDVAVDGSMETGLIAKELDGNLGFEQTTKEVLAVTGSNISGTFTMQDAADKTKEEYNITAGSFAPVASEGATLPDLADYLAEGCTVDENGTVTGGSSETKGDGSESNPYTLEQFNQFNRTSYTAAQEANKGTIYVKIDSYSYEKFGVLGNGRIDENGDLDDGPKGTTYSAGLNYYNANGYLGDNNDGANGHSIVFVGDENSKISSAVKGYDDIDKITTGLLLAVPAYTDVTFRNITFENVMNYEYQTYTGPWSLMGKLSFEDCTFNGIIIGYISAQKLSFTGCTFTDYRNETSPNNSNPTWIRPGNGNGNKADTLGQSENFRALTEITFENNTVTSTRPVKFERISEWDVTSTITATGNKFNMSKENPDGEKVKNVGMYFGTSAKFNLIVENNEAQGDTAALYTGEYTASDGMHDGIPTGSTVRDTSGKNIEVKAVTWKTTNEVTYKTTVDADSAVAKIGDDQYFATLAEAFEKAKDGDTITLLSNCSGNGIVVGDDKNPRFGTNGLTVDFGEHTYTVGGVLVGSAGTGTNAFQLLAGNKVMFKNGSIVGVAENTKPAEDTPNWHGAPAVVIQNYCNLTLDGMVITGGDQTVYTMSNNCGNITINNTTINAGRAEGYPKPAFAFDVYGGWYKDDVTVTVTGNSMINGDIEIDRDTGDSKNTLKLEDCTVNGTLKIGEGSFSNEKTAVSKTDGTTLKNEVAGHTWVDGKLMLDEKYVARIGTDKYFETLEAAVAGAANGDTIMLLKDSFGNGIKVEANKFATGLTIDFNTHTYTFNGTPVGSTGSETQAAHFESGNKITLKNGKFDAAAGQTNLKILVQNYCDTLTLDNMTLDGTNVFKPYEDLLTLSNNNGMVTIKDTTIIAPERVQGASNNKYAFDICGFQEYTGVTVTVTGSADNTSTINGNIKLSTNDKEHDLVLTLDKGTVNGKLVSIDGAVEKVEISKTAGFTVGAPAGYKWNETGTELVKDETVYVAQIGEAKYTSLQAAIDAITADGGKIYLLANISLDDTVKIVNKGSNTGKELKIYLSNYYINGADGKAVFDVENSNIRIMGGTTNGIKGNNGVAICAGTGAVVKINGGNYSGGDSAVCVTGTGNVTIMAGRFSSSASSDGKYHVLNKADDATGSITVWSGAAFVNYNPQNDSKINVSSVVFNATVEDGNTV